MTLKKIRSQRAVTLTELLVVLAIISLLATVAVPVYLSQIQRARIATAQFEVRQISEALQQCAIVHGFYVPIHILDNVPNQPSGSTVGGTQRDDFDVIGGGLGSLGVIDAFRNLETITSGSQLNLGSTDDRVEKLISGWQGPFLNPKRVKYVGEVPTVIGSGTFFEDLVVDPWGNPYRFYTDLGLSSSAGTPAASGDQIVLTMDDNRISSVEANRFDRYAVVSYGPDGTTGFTSSGNSLIQGDDVYYAFAGIAGNESRY